MFVEKKQKFVSSIQPYLETEKKKISLHVHSEHALHSFFFFIHVTSLYLFISMWTFFIFKII